jgi:hypothetical protein
MPFLVHWNNSGAVVTLCAATVAKADLLPDHLALAGVKGLSDADYPLLEIENLYVRRSDVVYIAEGRTVAAAQEKELIVAQEEKAQEAPISKPIQEEEEDCVPTNSVEKQIAGERTENGANASNSVIHSARAKRTRRARSRSTKI